MYESPAIGRIAADNRNWDPETWKPRIPNPAFLRARADDKFWAASKLMALTDDMIRGVVQTAEFGDAEAETALVRMLMERRDAIVRRHIPAVNPVVNPVLDASGRLRFENAAVTAGVAAEPAGYQVQWGLFDNATGETRSFAESTGAKAVVEAPEDLPTAPGTFVRVSITASGGANAEWEKPVRAYFRRTAEGWRLVGLQRQVETES
jgi:hypothetical protein